MSKTNAVQPLPLPFAVFDEFGKCADARVQDYAAAAVAEESERLIRRLREISMYECGCAEDANHCAELADQLERERGANQVVDDRLGAGAEARWYCVSREGMATLCVDEADAQMNAVSEQLTYPRSGPYRAAQLVDASAVAAALERRRDYDDSLLAAERDWKLVPLEPTSDMIDAAGMGWIIKPANLNKRLRIFAAMVAAAPNGPHVEAAEHERGAAEIDRLCAAVEHKDAALVGAAIEIHKLRAALAVYQGTGPQHDFAGLCPDETQPNSRDRECEACKVLQRRPEFGPDGTCS